MDLSVTINELLFNSCILNASGPLSLLKKNY